MIPFLGYSPKMRAGFVAVTSAIRCTDKRRFPTPSAYMIGNRVSTSTQPGDDRSNDSCPACLSSTSIELSSDDTVESHPPANPSHNAALSSAERNGGLMM